MPLPADFEHHKQKASAWFRQLRDGICAAFEHIEREVKGPHADRPPGKFVRESWNRLDHFAGRPVRLLMGEQEIRGVARGIAAGAAHFDLAEQVRVAADPVHPHA